MAAMKIADLPNEELRQFAQENLPQTADPQPQTRPVQEKKISLGLLCYDGHVHARTMMCIIGAAMTCAKNNWGLNIILREGDSMVARGRSFIASQFLDNKEAADCTDLVFIDTDLTWDGDEFERLCKHPVDVVGGAYPYKDETGDFPLRWPPDGIEEVNGLWSMDAVTPGFFRVTRRALAKIARLMPWIEFKDRGLAPDQRAWMFFDNLCRPSGVYDEGYVFCERWRQVGGKVWLDPTLTFKHIGLKAYSHGNIISWMDRKAKKFETLESEFPGVPPLKLMDKAMGLDVDLAEEQRRLKEIGTEEELNALAKKTMETMKAVSVDRLTGPTPAPVAVATEKSPKKRGRKPKKANGAAPIGPIVSGVAA